MPKRPFHLPLSIDAEDEEKRYTHAAFPDLIFLNVNSETGHVECTCGVPIITPVSYDVPKGKERKMALVPGCIGGHGLCPTCRMPWTVTRKQARIHNEFWDNHGQAKV